MPDPDVPGLRWEPYLRPWRDYIRITETSCCGVYEWAGQGGQFFVLRTAGESYEEAGRGRYKHARELWMMLMAEFERTHKCKDPDDAAIKAGWRGDTRPARSRRPKRSRTSAVGTAPGDA